MGNGDSLDELFEDTKQMIPCAFPELYANEFKIEQDVSGVEPSLAFIQIVGLGAMFLEDEMRLKEHSSYKGDVLSFSKNPNAMGFHIMISKLLPASN